MTHRRPNKLHLKSHCRPCFRKDGSPKRAFFSVREAELFRAELPEADGLMAYSCLFHGAHLGHFKYLINREPGKIARNIRRKQRLSTNSEVRGQQMPKNAAPEPEVIDFTASAHRVAEITAMLPRLFGDMRGLDHEFIIAADDLARKALLSQKLSLEAQYDTLKQERKAINIAITEAKKRLADQATLHVQSMIDATAPASEIDTTQVMALDSEGLRELKLRLGKAYISASYSEQKQLKERLDIVKTLLRNANIAEAEAHKLKVQSLRIGSIEAAQKLSFSAKQVTRYMGAVNDLYTKWVINPPQTVEECLTQLGTILGQGELGN